MGKAGYNTITRQTGISLVLKTAAFGDFTAGSTRPTTHGGEGVLSLKK
jgi:hypothetical protein